MGSKKYVIEIDEEPFTNKDGKKLYRASKFVTLVFDSYWLSMLEEYKEPEPEPEPEVKVGDVVETVNGSKIVVIKAHTNGCDIMGFGIADEDRECVTGWLSPDAIKRVISHYYSIERIMKELKDL